MLPNHWRIWTATIAAFAVGGCAEHRTVPAVRSTVLDRSTNAAAGSAFESSPHQKSVSGRVTDLRSGKPIPTFRILAATDDPGCASYWENSDSVGTEGYFVLSLDKHSSHRVRVEADGYLPACSETLQFVNGQAVFNATLISASNVEGTVLGTDGKPVGGVHVLMLTPSSGFVCINSAMESENGGYYKEAITDLHGRFSIPPPGEKYDLVALHASGYTRCAEEEFEKSAAVQLSPWSRIEGTISDDKGSAAGVLLCTRDFFAMDTSGIDIGFTPQTKTDLNGHYVIEHVPAGSHGLVRVVDFAEQRAAGFQCKTLATTPGQTFHLDFGAGGHTVSGRMVVPTGLPNGWHLGQPALVLIDRDSGLPTFSGLTWIGQFSHGSSRAYGFTARPDGSFRIPAAEPGRYSLVIEAYQPLPGNFCGAGDLLANYVREVVIPASGATTLDLGDCVLTKTDHIAIGDVAPEFQCQGFDGRSIKLSDFRGKYVLLSFWASWCGPCLEEIAHLKEFHSAHPDSPAFQMLGLNLDDNVDTAKKVVADKEITWAQGNLPGGFDNKAMRDYHLSAIPQIWLVDPQGRVAAKVGLPDMMEKTLTPLLSSWGK